MPVDYDSFKKATTMKKNMKKQDYNQPFLQAAHHNHEQGDKNGQFGARLATFFYKKMQENAPSVPIFDKQHAK